MEEQVDAAFTDIMQLFQLQLEEYLSRKDPLTLKHEQDMHIFVYHFGFFIERNIKADIVQRDTEFRGIIWKEDEASILVWR